MTKTGAPMGRPFCIRAMKAMVCCAFMADGAAYAKLPKLSPSAHFELRDGHSIPVMGLGVYMSQPGQETYNAVTSKD